MRMQTSLMPQLQQKMKLSPQIIQSIEILQLPLLALVEHIQQELVDNPVLEEIVDEKKEEDIKEEESEVDGEENFDLSENDNEQFEDDSEARIIEKWALIFRDIIPESYKNLKESQQKMKKKVDSSHSRRVNEEKGKEFKKGDIVFYKNIQKTSKWDEEFLGPVMINNCNKRTGNYILVDIDDPENIIANNIPPHFIRLLD